MRRFVFCILLSFPFHSFSALQMKCIAVGSAGNVSISWVNTSGAAGFRSYHIYHALNLAGPYTLVDSVNSYATQFYNHASANGNVMNAFYFVELNNTNGSTLMSDTLRSIRLSVIDPGDGYALLQWNSSHSPPVSTNSNFQLIYREYPAGVFTLIDSVDISVSSLNYRDEISICGDTVKYRVEVDDASGCTSVSTVDGDYFIDRIAPTAPPIDSVSVDASGNAVVGWTQSTSNDTYAYVIYQADNTSATPIDTVYGIGTTFYQSALDANIGAQGFRIVAIDTCGNPCGANPYQQSIFLVGAINRCSGTIQLSWNDYVNSSSAPNYTIVMSENGGGEVVVGTVTSNSYTVPNLQTDSSYCFKILAVVNGSKSSTSNTICATPDLPTAPQYSYIRSVSVFPEGLVTVNAYVDPLADIKEYQLQRGNSNTGPFVTVQTQAFSGNSLLTFTDAVSTDEIHYYRVASIDSCDNNALSSQVSHTLTADTTSSENFQNHFSWNSYGEWQGGVSQYRIYRSVDGIYDSSPYAVVSAADSSFSDDVRDLFSSQGHFCYYIVASEAPGNPYGFSDSARSNEICFRQKTGVFIPNAFRPGGNNSVFNPAEQFIGLDGYSLIIYDRFGEKIFESNNPSEGWDGSSKGHQCDLGVYVYRFTAKNEKGVSIEKIGRVTLIR